MAGFVKLDCGITNSSLWFEPPETRIVFITLLTKCDSEGYARCVRKALERDSNVASDAFERAMECLESPDPSSRDSSNEGIRIEKCEGGWLVLNYHKWRSFCYSDSYEARKKRTQRRGHVGTCPDVSPDIRGHSASASASVRKKKGSGEKEWWKTLEAVKLAAAKCGLPDREAEKFFNYYMSNGWRVGKNPMKSLPHAIANWKRNHEEKNNRETQQPMDYAP